MIKGIDVSSVQGVIDYAKLPSDYRFVIVKAQQGNDGLDPYFHDNVRKAAEQGLYSLAYCFAYPLPGLAGHPNRDPRDQAKLFVGKVYQVKELQGRPICLDLEWPPPEEWKRWGCASSSISDWSQECCAEVRKLTGVSPIIYTYPYWWQEVSKSDVSWANDYPLWIASYGLKAWPTENSVPIVPRPWSRWTLWQWSGGKVVRLPNGVPVDTNVFNGTEDDFTQLISTSQY